MGALRIQPPSRQVRNFSFSILGGPLLIRMWRPFLVFVLCLASASSIQWVKLDGPTEIKCTDSVGDILTCSWKTPTMDRPRWKLEEERMNINKSDCTVHIEKTQKTDEGIWECKVTYNKDDGFEETENNKKPVKIVEFS